MRREDWYGLVTSLLVHLLVLVGLSAITAATAEPELPGYIEVEFGDFADGRRTSRARAVQPVAPRPEPERPAPDRTPDPPPERAQPVRLPETTPPPAPERVTNPETETVAPAAGRNQETSSREETEPVRPLGSGTPTGTTDQQTGEDGSGADETRRAPFQIEGLNRQAVSTVLPRYTAQVNAIIRIRIEVSPTGRVVRRIPLIKGDPALEQAVMEALLAWRFNPLPPNAPQENQSGVVTFRFQLR